MRQSSVPLPEAPGGSGAPSPERRERDREQLYLLYVGILGAGLLSAGLWFLRTWIARASGVELLAGVLLALGAGIVLTVLAAYSFFATRVDRASEDVSWVLDQIAWGTLPSGIRAPRGLGRDARLAGAASAALTRLRTWVERSRANMASVEHELATLRATIPRMQHAVAGTGSYVTDLTRETRFLAAGAEENGALTQRASVLASVISQSQRDTTGFAERIIAAVHESGGMLEDCAQRTDDLARLIERQVQDSGNCLEVDRQLSEYLVAVGKTARRFKLLALHGAMEAARAGAQSQAAGTHGSKGGGEEFRVVALEVRRLAVELAKATEDIARILDTSRRSLHALHESATQGARAIAAARGALSLGVSAMDQAKSTAAARQADDSTLAEAGTELTILTSAIRERAIGAAKGTGDVADRLAMLDRHLSDAASAARDIEHALTAVEAMTGRARDSVTSIVDAAPAATTNPHSAKRTGKKPVRAKVRAQPRVGIAS